MANPITINTLTEASINGNGVFDILMRAMKEHLEQEFRQGRIKGGEYANVYLGSVQAVMETALQFVIQQNELNQNNLLKEKEIELAQQRIALAHAELAIQQAKLANIPKEGALLDAQAGVQRQQIDNLKSEKLRTDAQTAQIAAETANVPKQGALLDAQTKVQNQQALNLASEKLLTDARKALTDQQKDNAVAEKAVLVAQECKLRAEYDVLMESKLKTAAETGLLNQKKVTEQGQVNSGVFDANSILGVQAALYKAQADGFKRDAEQKAADIMVKAWATARTTDPDNTPMIGGVDTAVSKLLAGI